MVRSSLVLVASSSVRVEATSVFTVPTSDLTPATSPATAVICCFCCSDRRASASTCSFCRAADREANCFCVIPTFDARASLLALNSVRTLDKVLPSSVADVSAAVCRCSSFSMRPDISNIMYNDPSTNTAANASNTLRTVALPPSAG